jgi:threonyl-tRNA synthetase
MRFLMLHVDSFCCRITEKGRSKVYEDFDDPETWIEEALIVLSSVEKRDEKAPEMVAEKAATEIEKLARQLKVSSVVLHPFAHLFGELSTPKTAVEVLKGTERRLQERNFEVKRTPFGWFNTLEVKAKGHPISRVARIVTPD